MPLFSDFDPDALLRSALGLGLAFVLGILIGAERQYRNRSAGLRTNVLVCVAAAAFVELGLRLHASQGAVQMASYVVSGIGFLGAGSILRDGASVRGIDTAATLWASAAVGALSGAALRSEAVLLCILILAGNTLLRQLVNGINRLPFNERTSEARYQVHVTARSDQADILRDLLAEALETASYPSRSVVVYKRGEHFVEVVATLLATAINPGELDAVTQGLSQRPDVTYATWTQRTME